ncbi:hypothetical protein F444_22937 [Phytophthora nicotianae P1976]|uniref:Uncharacterized protein n=1 Tax=Phytophthora nicotianae P1976 TaxID=1317066 RepID=A0A080YWC0_PHYNI|nr:hypothetical protein F444_22937 [Phytophthora nicotianae P1976]
MSGAGMIWNPLLFPDKKEHRVQSYHPVVDLGMISVAKIDADSQNGRLMEKHRMLH